MEIVKSIKGIMRHVNTGNIIFAVIPTLGVAVNYGIKKIVEHEMQKNSTSETYNYSSYGQDAGDKTMNFTFGTGYSQSTDDKNVNFTFGGDDSSEIQDEHRNNYWWTDEIINPHKRKIVEEYEYSTDSSDMEEKSFGIVVEREEQRLKRKINAINELLQREVLSDRECVAVINLLANMERHEEKNRTLTPDEKVEQILGIVAYYYGITIKEIKSNTREKHIAEARQITAYLCKNCTQISLDVIGCALGGRDHATIIHGIKATSERIEKNEQLKKDIYALKSTISDKVCEVTD